MGTSTELHQITTINKENDLGIIFIRNFKFRSHIYKIVQKANKVLGIIKHTFQYLEPMSCVYCMEPPSIRGHAKH